MPRGTSKDLGAVRRDAALGRIPAWRGTVPRRDPGVARHGPARLPVGIPGTARSRIDSSTRPEPDAEWEKWPGAGIQGSGPAWRRGRNPATRFGRGIRHRNLAPGACPGIQRWDPASRSGHGIRHRDPAPGSGHRIRHQDPAPGSCPGIRHWDPPPGSCPGIRHRDPAPGSCHGIRQQDLATGSGTGIRHQDLALGSGTGIRHQDLALGSGARIQLQDLAMGSGAGIQQQDTAPGSATGSGQNPSPAPTWNRDLDPEATQSGGGGRVSAPRGWGGGPPGRTVSPPSPPKSWTPGSPLHGGLSLRPPLVNIYSPAPGLV
ncbi:uncharacterized protein LOC126035038 isoform X1 [Accipiter gentilis]|uniref:uncharacterized protein LOC126035038 isoform X1 n=1 Tax=Astur gentilis TaxID=8957 RepID=UPI00210F78CE|nr:uncharacterized protein LOC126035038 isoform X1 [Accipiter gentilis]